MKISQSKKKEIRRKLIEAAVELITAKGYRAATMRVIARQAGVGEATIYNYFATKEKIIYAYFEERLESTLKDIRTVEEFEDYSLHEKLQSLLESNLYHLMPDREFVAEVFPLAFVRPLGRFSEAARMRKMLRDEVRGYLDAAVESGELPEQPLLDFLSGFFWDYYLGVLIYWLRDDSEEFNATTQLVDLSLAFSSSLLRSGVVSHAADLMSFLMRTHLYDGLDSLRDHIREFSAAKEKFREEP